ncbi:MAG: hypothetical protein KA746_04020 [Pyrinomonadaceae bacterium]|nr:hypothetical protein [Pyrinomonadaceae bacterium]MBP6211412.1 hypothetical protein [Pyrinomonadaceae bacterium]
MKNLAIIFTVIAVGLFTNAARAQSDGGLGGVVKSGGLSPAMLGALKKSIEKVPQSVAGPETGGKAKNVAAFRPTPGSKNLETIASEIGKTPDERAALLEIFTQTKMGFEQEAAKTGAKNNLAGAMTFLLATCVTVFNDAPEPSDEITEKLFRGLNAMLDSTPEMASAPAKDKEFLYDTYISFGGMVLAGYIEAKQSNNKELLDQFRVIAGGLVQQTFGVDPTKVRFDPQGLQIQNTQNTGVGPTAQRTSQSHSFAKQVTNFDDGWVSTPTEDYVSVRKGGTEVRLYYDNPQLEATKRNTDGHSAFYWDRYILPFFNVGNVQKGDEVFGGFAINELLMADAVHKQTGERRFVGLWFLSPHSGGSKVFVVVAQSRAELQQLFPKAENIYPMLNSNRFAVTAEDMVGTWAGSGGGGVEYYSAYTGNYTGMKALSTSDNFVFSPNGSYQQTYLSANVASGGSQFARIDYKGRFSATDWEVTATNHYGGRTAKFGAQFIAVRGGYLLALTDPRNNVRYMLFKQR